MDNVLQTALAEAVNSLASFFGTTTESIMAHAPEFLAKYGWYSTLKDLPMTIILWAFLSAMIYLLCLLISDFDIKRPYLTFLIICIFCGIATIGSDILTCVIAPEIVGGHALLNLLKSAG